MGLGREAEVNGEAIRGQLVEPPAGEADVMDSAGTFFGGNKTSQKGPEELKEWGS